MSDPKKLLPSITDASKSGFPPHFAPPALKLPSGRFLSQTPAILNHIAPKLGLAGKVADGDVEEIRSTVNQLVLTVLDLSNEVRTGFMSHCQSSQHLPSRLMMCIIPSR